MRPFADQLSLDKYLNLLLLTADYSCFEMCYVNPFRGERRGEYDNPLAWLTRQEEGGREGRVSLLLWYIG